MRKFWTIVVGVVMCGCGTTPAPVETNPSTPSSGEPSTPASAPADPSPPASELVCCESFGYGAQMVKCCESYQWTSPDACVVPPNHVGGGKQVVDSQLCAAAPK